MNKRILFSTIICWLFIICCWIITGFIVYTPISEAQNVSSSSLKSPFISEGVVSDIVLIGSVRLIRINGGPEIICKTICSNIPIGSKIIIGGFFFISDNEIKVREASNVSIIKVN